MSEISIINNLINSDRLTNTFLNLVQIDSISSEESSIRDYILKLIASIGVGEGRVDASGNLLIRVKGTSLTHTVLLNAHLDTVEPGRGVRPVIVEGVIKSSGDTILGADNKAGVAAIIELLYVLAENPTLSYPSLEILFTVSEEVGSIGAKGFDYKQLNATYGYSFDVSGPIGIVVTASAFYNSLDITIKGKGFHAAKPEMGINALAIFCEWFNKITVGRVDDETVCNIGIVHSGVARNSIPAEVDIKAEVRSFSKEKLDSISLKMINELKLVAEGFGGSIEYVLNQENAGFKFSKDAFVVSNSLSVLSKLGIQANLRESFGCFDANTFAEYGLQVVNFGNGSKNPHSVEEEIRLEDLINTATIALGLVLS